MFIIVYDLSGNNNQPEKKLNLSQGVKCHMPYEL
jgi:hypothetical protein